LDQQRIVDQLYTTLYSTIPKSQTRLVVTTIVSNWENAQQDWDPILHKFDARAPVGAPAHTHNHPHEQDEELDPELGGPSGSSWIRGVGGFKPQSRPPTYMSTLEIPGLVTVGNMSVDQAREEENLRQAYAALAAWMEGAPKMGIHSTDETGSPPITPLTAITPSPLTPHTASPHTPSVTPCPLDRRPHVEAHAVPVAQYRCYACGNPSDGSDLKTCSGCRRTKYCDEVW
jgi:hypothetical protein